MIKVDLSDSTIDMYNEIHRWCTETFEDDYRWHHQPSRNKYWLELTEPQFAIFAMKWS